ncbi:hypothetical protein McpAg1_01560 [Methanocorpusculaceae archaeon Ag1]|uniref:Uncharacterized protein n=1 Tax=Methanorbis furvi TaxID=3028299 RepID=A0AAE4M9C1_9EURY|nr:hypothetical protein [Methanocorpusculaceae archaeon Ag1]
MITFELLLQCGLLGLTLELLRRVIRIETRVGLCKRCPITKKEVKKNVRELDCA